MSNIINFGGSGSGGSSGITAPIIGKDFTWTGGDGTYQVLDDGGKNWRIKFLSSGTFTPLQDMIIDAFLVGGGGGGANGESGSISNGGGGGGGGYTTTSKSIVLVSGTEYQIVVASGGAAKANGGTTTAFSSTANGGSGGSNTSWSGGSGGSGGGASKRTEKPTGGNGGSDGSDGQHVGGNGTAGTGQGTTTREFGEGNGDLYAGGGGAGGYTSAGAGGAGGGGHGGYNIAVHATAGATNTGGGGGGGSGYSSGNVSGAAGGSGIVIIRNHRSIPTGVIEGILQVGQLITFDGMKWRVVHNDGNLWYLAFNTIEESMNFGDDNTYSGSNIANRCVTWMNAYISAKAKNFMQNVTVSNVTSKVFIPTYDQVNGGFSYYNSNSNRIATNSDGTAIFWWTSTGSTTDSAYAVGSSGVLQSGINIKSQFGFRPHICIEYEA